MAASLLHRPSTDNFRLLPSFTTTAPSISSMRETQTPFQTLGHDISRRSSTSTQSSTTLPQLSRSFSNGSIQLPGLSALASLASYSAAQTRAPTPGMMSYPASAPSATPGGVMNGPPVCQNCTTSTTPLWRRDELGSVLCNACGLFLKLHGRPRPISLKTDIIKSRNRVKTAAPGQKRKFEANGLAATHAPEATMILPPQHYHLPARLPNERSPSPLSHTDTTGLSSSLIGHPSNIAPQHLFDGVTLDSTSFHSPSLPTFAGLPRQPSPGSVTSLEPPQSYDAMLAQNTALKTRVSELEVINDLFRGRVAELEHSDSNARASEMRAKEAEERSKQALSEALAREAELKRRLEELEEEQGGDGHRAKRLRMGDEADGSGESTPLSDVEPTPV